MKRDYLLLLASPLIILSGCHKPEKSNVILFLVDDLGWTDLACYGSDMYQSPNIDKLASEGMPNNRREGCEGFFSLYCNPRLEDGPDGEYLTERLAEEAVKFIKNRKGKKEPFFMDFWFYNVHTPLQAREEKIEKYRQLVKTGNHHSNPVYAAMIEHLDDAVGKVMNVLKEEGLDDNTIVIFTSDNGGYMNTTFNYPLRNGKGDLFEGGVRVPFIARWNNKIKAGTVNHNPVISIDLYLTILNLTKVLGNPSHNAQMDGVDISETLLHHKSLKRETLFWHYPHYHPGGALPYSAIRKGNWKLIEIFEHDNPMLFNLESDIGEKSDLYGENPEKAAELLSDLKNWRDKVKAQMPLDNPDWYRKPDTY